MEFEGTITITFGDCAENHVGMQKIGHMSKNGFSVQDLKDIKAKLWGSDIKSDLYDLTELLYDEEVQEQDCRIGNEASILVIRDGVDELLNETLMNKDDVLKELLSYEWDTKAKMKGKVVNKHARYNLCFSDYSQEADFDKGQGTVIDFKDCKGLRLLRGLIGKYIGKEGLQAEGNKYYDLKKCYIGFHGDGERKVVVGIRFGESLPFYYKWFKESKPVSELFEIKLNHGDIYIMSEKATGNDWLKKKIPTLRHAAGNRNIINKLIRDIYGKIQKRKVKK
jgi:hypothetical protein